MELAEKAVAEGKKLPRLSSSGLCGAMSEEGGVELVREQAAKLGIAFEIYESGVKKAHLKGEDVITKEFATTAVCANSEDDPLAPKSWKALRTTWKKASTRKSTNKKKEETSAKRLLRICVIRAAFFVLPRKREWMKRKSEKKAKSPTKLRSISDTLQKTPLQTLRLNGKMRGVPI